MEQPSKRLEWIVWGAIGATIAAIVVAFVVLRVRRPPDVLDGTQPGPNDALPVLFPVAEFTLTNQSGRPYGLANLRDHVWIAEVIFTRCGGPCPRMTQRMSELQAAIPAERPVRFVTLTTDPEFDTPPVLKGYARRFNADPARWHFLTGSRAQMTEAIVRGLKLTAQGQNPARMQDPNDLFIHSTILLVVDKQGRARAVIETEPVEDQPPPDVKAQALPIVERLLKE
jgi:protein SCO1/2